MADMSQPSWLRWPIEALLVWSLEWLAILYVVGWAIRWAIRRTMASATTQSPTQPHELATAGGDRRGLMVTTCPHCATPRSGSLPICPGCGFDYRTPDDARSGAQPVPSIGSLRGWSMPLLLGFALLALIGGVVLFGQLNANPPKPTDAVPLFLPLPTIRPPTPAPTPWDCPALPTPGPTAEAWQWTLWFAECVPGAVAPTLPTPYVYPHTPPPLVTP